jgi:hypothetical protein
MDVRQFGAFGNGSTSPSAQAGIQAAINAAGYLVPPYNVVLIPAAGGVYCLNGTSPNVGGIVVNTSSVILRGAGRFWANLDMCGDNTAPMVTLNGEFDQIEQMTLWGKGWSESATMRASDSFGATYPALKVTANVFVRDLFSYGGSVAILQTNGEAVYENVWANYGYNGSVLFQGQGGGAVGAWLKHASIDNNWPYGYPGGNLTINAWAANTAYSTLGTVVTTQGWYIQLVQTGTSCSSCSFPVLKNYFVDIVDGTAAWQLVSPVGACAWQLDSQAAEIYGSQVDITGNYTHAICTTDSLSTGNTVAFRCDECIPSQSFGTAVDLTKGSYIYLFDTEAGAVVQAGTAAIQATSTFTGALQYVGGFIFSPVGVLLSNGAGGSAVITGATIGGGTGNGISVAASVGKFIVNGNIIGSTSGYGVQVYGGASDYYDIVNNICAGSTALGCLSDGGTGTHKTLTGNW